MNIHLTLLFPILNYRQMEQTSSIVPSSDDKGKQIVTHSEGISLADLTETDHDKVIYVKAYRKWTPTNKQGKPVVFCVMLIDKQVQNTNSQFIETIKIDNILINQQKKKNRKNILTLPTPTLFTGRGYTSKHQLTRKSQIRCHTSNK